MEARFTGSASRDDAYHVSDPTDWLNTPLASLLSVEQALRCHVCKDFYNSPMVTSCSHTFCSLCIRRALSTDGKCPLCRTTDQESRLRGNWAMREAVEAFAQSRDVLLAFARQPVTSTPALALKRTASNDDNDAHKSKRTRMSLRASASKGAQLTANMLRQEEDVPDSRDTVDHKLDDGLVECPICQRRMKPQRVYRHLDIDCPGPPQPSKSPKKDDKFCFPASRATTDGDVVRAPERLPSLSYPLMKDHQLRKKLTELGLSTSGSRQLLEKRHKEWITIWNANCDSARPKKKSELLRDLDVWERTVGVKAPVMSYSANVGAHIRDKNFDGAAWAADHRGSFKDLIANARRTRKEAQDQAKEASTSSNDTGSSFGPPAGRASTEQPGDMAQATRQYDTQVSSQLGTSCKKAETIDLTIPSSSQIEPETESGECPEPFDRASSGWLRTDPPLNTDTNASAGAVTTSSVAKATKL